MDIAQSDLKEAVRAMPKMGFVGINVTIPHKETILGISKPNKSPLYSPDGETLSTEGYQQYTDNLGLENIAEFVSEFN